jgi:hypothetical protein
VPVLSLGDGNRSVPFDRSSLTVHLNDRPKNVLPLTAELQQFIFEYSEMKAMKHCSKHNPCMRRLCPWCARRVTDQTRRSVQPLALTYNEAIAWTSTTESFGSFEESWEAQRMVVARFLSNRWLTKRTSAWMRETEITHSGAGWHVHTHWLLFLETSRREEAARILIDVPIRWCDAARQEGVAASLRGQDVKVHSDVRDSVRYATKGIMTASKRSGQRTLAEILADYQKGDADAADHWVEFAKFFTQKKRRNWRATGGAFRGRTVEKR